MEPRGRTIGLLACLLAAVVLGPAAASAEKPARDDGERSVASTFERGLAGWRADRARLRLVRRGDRGRAALVTARGRGRMSFSVYRSRPLVAGAAGSVYSAAASVRGTGRGFQLCLRVTEAVGRRAVGQTARCAHSTGRWQRLGLTYVTKRAGSSLVLSIEKPRSRRGGRFRVDDVILQAMRNGAPPDADTAPPTNPPPPPSGGASGPAMGVQFHCNWAVYNDPDRIAVLDKLQAAGVRWVRIDTAWNGIEDTYKGSRNIWHIRMVDFCVNQARAHGMKVLITLWLTPGWANGNQSDKVPPTNVQDYAHFARWAATYWRGRVDAWEVWNEPDQSGFWRSDLATYVDLLKAAYPGFKAGDPNAQVVLAGPSSNDDGWMRQVYALGGKGSFDVLATHPYQGMGDYPPEYRESDGRTYRWWFTHLPVVRQVMIENGDAATPIWFTEFGWSAHANWPGIENWQRGVTQAQQADFLIRSLRYTKANYPYVPVMFWYKERAKPGGTDVVQEGYGLLDANLAERPVYAALKNYLTAD